MLDGTSRSGAIPPPDWKRRWIARRNRVIASPAFQKWASILWPVNRIARARAASLFDLVAGFAYSQTLSASVECGLLDLLADGPANAAAIASHCDLPEDAALRLVRAAAALEIAEEVSPGFWMLGQQGAALQANEGAKAMIRHHRLLYADLADPLALLRTDRREETGLSRFWHYACASEGDEAEAYSRLMAESQAMVCEQVLGTYDFSRHSALLDLGGGHGRFISGVAAVHPQLKFGIFDLPAVLEGTRSRVPERVALHPGNFFDTPVPEGYDCIALVRILHDHDDDRALHILRAVRAALPPGGTLVLAEPMADTPGARAMGDAYFGLYLWAMNSGRPRSAKEIDMMLRTAGFSASRTLSTRQPIITRVTVALA